MSRKLVFRPQADQEVQAARQWHDEQRPGLGVRFADALDHAVERIASTPFAFPVVHGKTRRAVVKRFPYGIYFHILADDVVVTAVMHEGILDAGKPANRAERTGVLPTTQ